MKLKYKKTCMLIKNKNIKLLLKKMPKKIN